MSFADGSHAYESPGGPVVYGDEAFQAALRSPETRELDAGVVDRFHALVDEVTEALMAGQPFDRASCRADAITLLLAASERAEAPESPLKYLLQEERQKAMGALGALSGAGPELVYLKA